MKKRRVSAFSVSLLTVLIAIIVCTVLIVLHNDFGMLSEEKYQNTQFSIELIVDYGGYVKFEKEQVLFLSGSREKLGVIENVEFDDENNAIITILSNGFYKNNAFMLNGQIYLTEGSDLEIMNNSISVEILKINKIA